MCINMDTALWLDGSLNLQIFEGADFDPSEHSEVLENLRVSKANGEILAVDRDKVLPFLEQDDVRKIRYGLKKMPKAFTLNNEDDFWKIVALCIPLEEY